jgi:hypothetical protein
MPLDCFACLGWPVAGHASTAVPSRIMSHPSLELRPVAQLKENLRNARMHSKKQVRQIADSIRRFGFTNPVLVDGEGAFRWSRPDFPRAGASCGSPLPAPN